MPLISVLQACIKRNLAAVAENFCIIATAALPCKAINACSDSSLNSHCVERWAFKWTKSLSLQAAFTTSINPASMRVTIISSIIPPCELVKIVYFCSPILSLLSELGVSFSNSLAALSPKIRHCPMWEISKKPT